MFRYTGIIGAVLGALWSLSTLEAGAQPFEASDASNETELSHGSDFFDDHIVVGGTIKNISRMRFPCLMVVFNFGTSQGRTQNGVMIRDLRPGEKRSYSQRFPAAEWVGHATTLTCAAPETDTAVRHCTVTGELHAPRGFRQRIKDSPNDPGMIVRLNEVLLIKDRAVIDRAPLSRGETLRTFRFERVPPGETFQIGLGLGWAFQGFEQVEVRCGRPGATRSIGRKRVQTVGEG